MYDDVVSCGVGKGKNIEKISIKKIKKNNMNSQMPSVRNETLQKQKSMRKFSVKIFVFSYSFL